jgi:hypothetical protein
VRFQIKRIGYITAIVRVVHQNTALPIPNLIQSHQPEIRSQPDPNQASARSHPNYIPMRDEIKRAIAERIKIPFAFILN